MTATVRRVCDFGSVGRPARIGFIGWVECQPRAATAHQVENPDVSFPRAVPNTYRQPFAVAGKRRIGVIGHVGYGPDRVSFPVQPRQPRGARDRSGPERQHAVRRSRKLCVVFERAPPHTGSKRTRISGHHSAAGIECVRHQRIALQIQQVAQGT